MKPGLFALFLFLLLSHGASAQDMIITQYGDTLNNKVIYSTKRYLFYVDSNYYGRYLVKGIRKTKIENSRMNAFRVDSYTTMMNERALKVMGNPYMIQGGVQVSYTPFIPDSDATSSEKEFYGKLSIGISYNVSFHLRMRPHSFIGIVIDDNRNTAFADKLDIKDDAGNISHLENIRATLAMTYVGPEFLLFKDSKKFTRFFILSGGVGYASAKWTIRALNRSPEVYKLKGIGLRISVAKTWALGRTFIVGPNAKFVNVLAGDTYGNLALIPRLNLGLSVLVH